MKPGGEYLWWAEMRNGFYGRPDPERDGAVFGVMPNGTLQLLIQAQNPGPVAEIALKRGFLSCFIHVEPAPPFLAAVYWEYLPPFGLVETHFHAGLYRDGRVDLLLKCPMEEQMLTVTVVDGLKIVLEQKIVLPKEVLTLIVKQDALQRSHPVTWEQYELALAQLYSHTPAELFLLRDTP